MRGHVTILAAICMLTIATVPATATPSPVGDASAGNGYVMMVHGSFEPWVAGPPPIAEALAATNDDGQINLHVIPYDTDTERPAVVDAPNLTIVSPQGDVLFDGPPNAPSAGDAICQEETSIDGHEGPIEACHVFQLDADTFDDVDAVTMVFSFEDADGTQYENYNAAGHILLHASMEGAPVDLDDVDATFDDPTPYAIESAVDPAT